MHRLKAVIFDCDGTLFDSETVSFQSWREIFDEYGVSLPLKKWTKTLGTSEDKFDPFEYLQSKVKQTINKEKILTRRTKRKIDLVNSQGLRRGIKSFIEDAKNKKLYIAIASSSSRNWVFSHIERLKLENIFDCVICSEDVEYVKPKPDIYLEALKMLSIKPEEAIAIEDSPNGISSAKAAGIFCIAVPNELTSQLNLSQADLKLKSLSNVDINGLLHTITRLRNSLQN